MIDIQFIRDNPELVAEKSKQKGYEVDIKELLRLDADRLQLLGQVEEIRRRRNENAEKMKQGGKPDQDLVDTGKQIKIELAEKEEYLAKIDTEWRSLLKKVPNMPTDDVPMGISEQDNVVSKTVGDKTEFAYEPKSHWQIAEARCWLDKERAAKVTGARFTYIMGDLVKLQFAIIQFVMDKLTDQDFIDSVIADNNLSISNKTFIPVLPPLMLRTKIYSDMDRLEPTDERYKIEGEDLWLQGSAEHVIGSMHAEEILDEAKLPLRYIGYATSFRREAGTYGKDMEGMFRMHQFDKLEMESFSTPDSGLQEHFFMVALQEKLMQLLDIPYRVLNKCIADIGKPNSRGVDIDAWLPSQNKYRETHTADYMTDYQARRLNTKVKRANGQTEFIHTNDATALPLSRGPIAIIENYQNEDMTVRVPDVLKPYIGGKEVL